MGCDIHGYIEYKQFERTMWWGVVEIDILAGRNYDMFGSLFGVRNYANFKPMFADRGCPKDVSMNVEELKKKWGRDAHSWSYVTATDILDFELSLSDISGADERIHELRITKDNDLIEHSKSGYSSQLEKWGVYEVMGVSDNGSSMGASIFGANDDIANAPDAVTIDDNVFARVPITRREVYDSDWKFIFRLMKTFAKEFGNDNVRLIVWFDN